MSLVLPARAGGAVSGRALDRQSKRAREAAGRNSTYRASGGSQGLRLSEALRVRGRPRELELQLPKAAVHHDNANGFALRWVGYDWTA
jgi:hypothetical protein